MYVPEVIYIVCFSTMAIQKRENAHSSNIQAVFNCCTLSLGGKKNTFQSDRLHKKRLCFRDWRALLSIKEN